MGIGTLLIIVGAGLGFVGSAINSKNDDRAARINGTRVGKTVNFGGLFKKKNK